MNNPISDVFSYNDLTDYESFLEEELICNWNSHQEEHFGNNCEANDYHSEVAVFARQYGVGSSEKDFNILYADEIAHFKEIEEFVQQIGDYGDRPLIHKDYWEDYVREKCFEFGHISREVESSGIVVDWEATARVWKVDYSEVEYNGETYYVRS